ncbi:MAG TPA: trehalose-phosphatase [Caulobacteraceae bacterium]|jgi:trehalose 6-phosphate phosphatase
MAEGSAFPTSAALLAPPLPRAADSAVFVDLDGTLAALKATPQAVGPDPKRRALLQRLQTALSGRLAIVSGRGLEDIDRVLEKDVPAVAAIHGLVRRTAWGEIVAPPGESRIPQAREAFESLARADTGLLVEDKGAAVALHYRGSPQAEGACRELAARLAEALGLKVQEGNHVVELRAPGPDKGEAISAFMRETPFTGAQPLFLGDDLTDESGFAAVRAIGGLAIIVGPRRPTRAQYALADVSAVHAFLSAIAEQPTA